MILVEIDDYSKLAKKYEGIETEDFGSKIICPGFIDLHNHFPQTQVIASYGTKLLEWLNKYTFPEEAKFISEDYSKQQAKKFLKLLITNGTTTSVSFCSVHKESVNALFQEASKKNMCMIAGKVMMDRNAPKNLLDTPQSSYEDSQALISKWHKKNRNFYAITPRFAITSSPEQLKLAGELVENKISKRNPQPPFITSSFVILFPFYMMFVTSFKTQIALLVNPLDFSINFTQDLKDLFKSYFVIFKSYKFGKYILTSTIVSVGTVIITLLFAIPAAYAVARLNFFGKTFLSTSILIIYMFPAIVLVIPLYTIFSQLGLRNSIEGLLIVYTATTLPVAIYMLQGYFKSIPKELEEAAILDKLSWFGIITKIIIPLSIPAISSVALYVFMIAWNEFLFSLMFLDNPNSFTLSRAIQYLSGDAETPRQYLMAGSVVVTLPVLFIFVYFEKYLVSGLTAGSVKG